MEKVKITVTKRFKPEDVLGKEMKNPQGDVIVPCEKFKEGQEFIMDNDSLNNPDGFCEWAWKDLLPYVSALATGGNFLSWFEKGVAYGACTDGLRPVCFKLERIS